MTHVQLTPFQELEAMLLFGTEEPITTMGEVEEHLRQARHSLMISRINGGMGDLAIQTLLEKINDTWGEDSTESIALRGIAQHMQEMLSIEIMATERDCMVMESFILFMSSRGSGEE
jgi:hypothetical protein